jgi:putative methyltransferase (TIGR04325 family)
MVRHAENAMSADAPPRHPPTSVWEGVYDSFPAAGTPGRIFDGETWLTRAAARLDADLAALRGDRSDSSLALIREHPLPLLAATLCATRRSTRILDFGGGLGTSFLRLLASLPAAPMPVDYHIVELPSVVAVGRERFGTFPNLHFHSSIPRDIGPVDIVCAVSSLHYIEDWRGCLRELVALRPAWLLLADVPAGDIPTFVTHQVYYGSRMPVWFWNRQELVEAVNDVRYRLTYEAGYRATILGREGPLPMDALPETHRLDHCRDFLFSADS